MIAIFGVVYAWLACQINPIREFVLVSAVGKLAFFAVCVASWLANESSPRIVAIGFIDAALAVAFLYGLPKRRSTD